FNRNLSTGEIVGQLWHANRALLAGGVTTPWVHGGPSSARRAAPRAELRPLRGQRSGEAASVGGPSSARRAAPRAELRPLRGQRSGEAASVGGPSSARRAAPRAELRPLRGQRSGEAASVGEPSSGRAPITNVVMMGMGEPLANFDNVVAALRLMLDDNAYGLSRRRVTLSTSGIVPMIDGLRVECPVALAVSLHAPNDALRDTLMPINRKYPLAELLAACRRYLERAPRDFITFEYVMLEGVNDAEEHARQLIDLVSR